MKFFRKTVAATALAAAAVLAGSGMASAADYRGGDEEMSSLHFQCNDIFQYTAQYGAVNFNQGPICINF